MSAPASVYRRHCFPPMIISHADYLYFHCTASCRDAAKMRAMRGIVASYETIRGGA